MGWGMRHTLDMFVRETVTEDCIAIEVKLCRLKGNRTADFQRMIGQSVMFMGASNHRGVVAVFGFQYEDRDAVDAVMAAHLHTFGIWPVLVRVP